MKSLTLFFCVWFICNPVFAQVKYDYVWALGYSHFFDSPSGFDQGGNLMDFKSTPPSFMIQSYPFDRPFASISDRQGELFAYTDGCRIVNKNHQVMVNGDTLNPGAVYNEFCPLTSYPIYQPCIFLPAPGNDSLFYLFHLRADNKYYHPINLMYSIIDTGGDNGNGAVITKNNSVLSDSLHLGNYLTATRHANGRDWWIIVARRLSNNFHVSLLSPNGVEYLGMQDFDHLQLQIDTQYCCSQNAFSWDGSKHLRNSPDGLFITDFDRCSGTLSNPVYFDWDSMPFGGGGVATSPDSRFLYLSSGETMFQYDLNTPDIASSGKVIAQYDGFSLPFPTGFFQMMNAPDGRIYIVTTQENMALHYINFPNREGSACSVVQHGIILSTRTSWFAPNFPNYRLGPIDGSPCDTLGIDNLPVAHFRYEAEDTLVPLAITFTDLSYYEPATWSWTFGDPASGAANMSQDTSPVHLFSSPGMYEVCLTVCNDNACDTLCKTVSVGISGVDMPLVTAADVQLWPNPARDVLHFQAENVIEWIELYDAQGRMVLRREVADIQADIAVHKLPAGLYLAVARTGAGVWAGRFVVGR